VAILVDDRSRILIQGITGNIGANFARETKRLYPDVLVAGVTPGRGGQTVAGVPVYDAVAEAVDRHGADTALVCAPPAAVRDSVIEALDAGIRLLAVYAEGVPLHEAALLVAYARAAGARLLGPNAAGVLSPGRAGMGEITEGYFPARPGRLGIVAKSGSIMYETVALTEEIEGQSTMVCLGGDPILGTTFRDVLPLFEADPGTAAVVLIGEIGGPDEVLAAEYVRSMRKPVVAYICGHSAPPVQKMGHAGAIVIAGRDTAAAKSEALRAAGASIARTLPEVPDLVRAALAGAA
jgi:succinyl-CoA synthetase alpha subunit